MAPLKRGLTRGPKRQNLKGRRFGRLTVESLHHVDDAHHGYWTCACDCGGSLISRDSRLKSGRTVSCGCWRKDSLIRQAARWEIPAERRKEIAALGGTKRKQG